MSFTDIQPQLQILKPKKLVDLSRVMSFANTTTFELWKSFMPRRKDIQNAIGTELYSIQYYDLNFFEHFNPKKEFTKFAATEVSNFQTIPEGMESFILPEGLYAVFYYKGLNTDSSIFEYIHGAWLRQSGYQLDVRPHFEILGENIKTMIPPPKRKSGFLLN